MLGPFATVSRFTYRCPRRQRQRVTEGTAMAPWNGPNQVHASRASPSCVVDPPSDS